MIDSDDETLLAQASEPLPVLQPGESRELRVMIPSSGRPEPDVIIGTFARVGDLSAMNDEDWLMLGDAEEEEPGVPIITDLDPPVDGPQTVRFLAPPKTIIAGGRACMLVTALVSGGDSTEKLDEVVFEVVGGDFDSYYFHQVAPGRWSALSTGSGLIAGKTFECYLPDPESYKLLKAQDPRSLGIAVTLEARGADPHTEVFPLDPEFIQGVLELPEPSG